MEKVIKIDLMKEEDIIDTYNSSRISPNLLNYLINEARFIKKEDTIKILINNICQTKLNYKEMLYEAFQDEFLNIRKEHIKTNIIQLLFFIMGIFFIFLAFQINNNIWKEILLISGWVPIWEMIDLELFNDTRGQRKKMILNKLINSQID